MPHVQRTPLWPFRRRIPLGWEVDEDRIEASFRNGVLIVTMPKSAQAAADVKRIAVNRAEETKHWSVTDAFQLRSAVAAAMEKRA